MASLAPLQFPDNQRAPVPAPVSHAARLRCAPALARKLPAHLRFLYLYVVESMFPDDTRGSSTWRSLKRIARDVGVCERTARSGVDRLVQLGYLRRDYSGAVYRKGKFMHGSNGRTPKLSFVFAPEQERAQRDARHAQLRATADANRAARKAEFDALHERRVRIHAAAAKGDGALPLADAAVQLAALDAEEHALERACGYTWNRNTVKAEQRKARRRTTPTLGGKPRADAQFVRPDTLRRAVAKLASAHDTSPDAPPCATCSRRHAPREKCWYVTALVAECACGAYVVQHPDTRMLFEYDSGRHVGNPNAPHECATR